ncbi:DUF2975 domain-containing protein [Cognatitamlana onchidii]|uniref:DUF2975 domain-containing protein n=1 Tax=Cognatitamlana onchidii TaxID=2562860 RepID=UPI0010A60795|nr:DUF2975 domain-containing protein [Algibacter onchidii]
MKKLAYLTSLVLFYIVAIVLLFVFLFSALAFLEYKLEIDMPFIDIINGRGKVYVPFIGLNINVPFNYAIIIMWGAMTYYAIYFYAFKEFLKVFVKNKIFETKSLKRLRFFLKLNILPIVYIVLFTASFLIQGIPIRFEDDYFIVLAHLVIAFLMYLYLDVLKKGSHIQEENDLTI